MMVRERYTGDAAETLHTVSLRHRITVVATVVLIAALLTSGVLVAALFTAQSNRDTRQQLVDREVVARQLDRRGVPPAQIARRVSGRGILAKITTEDGITVGPAVVLARSVQEERRARTSRLPDGAKLTLLAGKAEQRSAESRLNWLLVVVGIGTVVVTAVALLVVVGYALRPLDRMTALATSIARGRRGTRLAPNRGDTELGRAAAAFDEMLEALEGAEHAARESESRTRRFVADAAHELRTPVAGVQSAAGTFLHADATDTATRERMSALVIQESRRLARLVDDLVSLARIDEGLQLDMRPVELHRLAHTEVDRMRLLATGIRWQVTGTDATARCDADRIGQVLTNVLQNARRHTPDNGTVLVRIDDRRPGYVDIVVSDTGPGVPVAERERIFDRLVRLAEERSASNEPGGAGLGLAIARGIVRAHGGELSCIDPEVGFAATFLVTLPK